MSTSADSVVWKVASQINSQLSVERKEKGNQEKVQSQQAKQKNDVKDILETVAQGRPSSQQTDSGTAETPTLPPPPAQSGSNSIWGDPNAIGLIAIISRVLILQSKMNSNFWSNLWKQASQTMQIQVSMAPLIAKSTISAARNEANATLEDASKEKEEGAMDLATFGMSVGTGAFMAASEGVFSSEKPPLNGENETEKGAAGISKSGKGAAADAEAKLSSEVDDISGEQNKAGWGERAKNTGKKVWKGNKTVMERFGKLLGQISMASAATQQLMGGITKLTIDAPHDTNKAAFQLDAGRAQAFSKELESYQQYYGQSYSRAEDLRQGSQQNIDYAMNILNQAANTITSTVVSMFQG